MAEQDEKKPSAAEEGSGQEAAETQAGQPEPVAGVGIVVIGYTSEHAADQVLQSMNQAKNQGTFYFEDAAVIRQDAKGKVHIKETKDMSSGAGAGIGAVVGGLIGLLGGPAGVALGAGIGAGVGGGLAHHDAGFRNEGLKDVASALRPGTSALVVTTSKAFVEQVRKQVPAADLADVSRQIAQDISDSISAGQDMALGMLFTEKGIAVREVRVSDEVAEMVGIVATDDSLTVEAGIVTAVESPSDPQVDDAATTAPAGDGETDEPAQA